MYGETGGNPFTTSMLDSEPLSAVAVGATVAEEVLEARRTKGRD